MNNNLSQNKSTKTKESYRALSFCEEVDGFNFHVTSKHKVIPNNLSSILQHIIIEQLPQSKFMIFDFKRFIFYMQLINMQTLRQDLNVVKLE